MKSQENYYEASVRYFGKPGPSNTQLVLECVNNRARELGIKEVLVASVTGSSALRARDVLSPDIHLIAVTHVAGFEKPDHQEMPPEIREKLLSIGINVLTAQHAFGGVGRGIRKQLGTYQVDEIMAYTLRTFGHGTKVAIELALMAADAGLVRTDRDIISVGGTGNGLDSALVLQPSNSADFLRLKVREIICKPSKF
ncbi:MAG: hypothetical protein M1511_16920 [Deltaproteobacteria bacterium]|nr:hypothetical protein [Deltaproteobacteria bacterium]